MSKNTNLSFLTDFLTADIVNSRVGMNNASPQATFDVTGTGKFSGILTLGSTVSNGTYTYTLPSATGTLALTSDIPSVSGYVPYTGATSALQLGYNALSASFLRVNGNSPTTGSYLGFKHSTSVTTGAPDYTSIYTFGTNLIGFKSISGATTKDFSFSMSGITPGVPGGRTYTLPDASGTLALTSQIPANAVGGTGTTNYLPKFTGSTTIGNSLLSESGTGRINLYASSGFAELYVKGSGSTSGMYLFDQNTESGLWKVDSGYMAFATTNIEAMRIFSGQNVHIGPTPASDNGARLQVSGNTSVAGLLYTTVGNGLIVGGTGFAFAPSSTRGSVQIVGSGDRVLAFGSNGAQDLYIYSAPSLTQIVSTPSFSLVVGGLDRFNISSTGAATFTSSVTANGMTLLNSGGTYLNYYVSTYLIGRIGNVDTNDMYYDSTFGGNHYFRTGTGGTTSPTTKFTIASSGAISNDFSASGAFAASFTNSNSTGYGLYVRGGSNVREAILIADNAGNQNIRLYGNGSATFSSTVAATQGNFTSAPSLGGHQIQAVSNSGGNTSYGGVLLLSSTGKGAYLTCGDNSVTTFYGAQASFISLGGTAGVGMKFRVDADDTKGITIPTSGNVLIGSPPASDNGQKLQVNGNVFLTDGANQHLKIQSSTGDYSYLFLKGGSNDGYLLQNFNGSTGNGVSAGAMYFYMSNSQQFEFNWGGVSKIQFTSTGAATFGGDIYVSGIYRVPLSSYFICGTAGYRFNNSTNAFNNFIALDNGNATLRGTLTQNASDERLKNNIEIIPNAINKIKQLRGITFEWNKELYETSRTFDIGVIAQEVEKVLPNAVCLAPFDTNFDDNTSKSGQNYLTVYYEKLIPLLIEGIKEQQKQIEELKNKLS